MMEHDDLFFSPEPGGTLSLLRVEKRIKELNQECEDLIEYSKLLHRDRQYLSERFAAGMKRSQALQKEWERHLLKLKAKQQELGNAEITNSF